MRDLMDIWGDVPEGKGGRIVQKKSVTITVWTPTLCKPDTLDRPCYFPFLHT